MKNQKFSHKTPHLKATQHQLDPNLDLKQLVHHSTVQYVDRDADGDVDVYDNPKKKTPDENPIDINVGAGSKKLLAKQKGELKHTRTGMAYEDLRKWFGTGGEGGVGGGGWDRYNTKGERVGKCAREPGEPKPKCLSKEKAAKMSKDEIAAAVKRKREKDPVADREGKGGKPIMSSNNIEEGLLRKAVDKLKGRKEIGRTASGGRIYQSTSQKPTTVKYAGKTQDQIRKEREQKKADIKRKTEVRKGTYDDPWLKSAPAAERRLHYQQLRGESVNERRYCMKCKKMESRDECSYGPEMWDKMTIANVKEAVKKDHEYSMARSQLSTVMNAAKRLKKKMAKGEGEVEAWVQSKITKAADYLDAAADYIDSGEHDIEEEKGPCWTGYKQVGMKKKNGKEVPNCVPVSEADLTIDPQKHRQAQRAQKIRTLAQKGSTEGERAAAERKTKGPKLFGEDLTIADKILLEMEAEVLNEKNVPTNPSLWSKMKAKAKAKFDVYPSAYANGWAAREYKKAGGGWKSVSEETIEDLNGNTFVEIVDLIKPDPINVEESVRIPSKSGNLMMVIAMWRGRSYSLRMFFPQVKLPTKKEVEEQIQKVYPGAKVIFSRVTEQEPGQPFLQVSEDWQSVNRKDKTDGLSQKAVDAYRRENPGSKLQTAVTEKKPTGKRAERRKSFCSRMKGMKKRLTSAETARDPDSRINKALRRWNCN